jgi:predicted PurR-regulated permease PerM
MDLAWERSRYAWGLVGMAAALTVGFVLYSFVGTIVFGVFVYYASRPVYRRLSRRVANRVVAATLSLIAVILPVLLLLGYAIAIGLQEFSRLDDRVDFGVREDVLAPYIDIATVFENPGSLLQDQNLTDSLRPILDTALTSLGTVGNGLLHGFIVFALAYYLLKDGARLRRWFERRFADSKGILTEYFTAVDRDLHRVFSGNIANALFTAVLGAVAYNTLASFVPPSAAIPYPTLIGLLAGAASLIPVVGMKLVYVPVAGYLAGVQYFAADPVWWPVVAFVLLSFVVVDTIPDLIIRPLISGGSPSARVDTTPPFVHLSLSGEGGLHVGLIMFAYIFGPILFGWYGLFLGPMALVAITHFGLVVLPELLNGERLVPAAVDPSTMTDYDPAAGETDDGAEWTEAADPDVESVTAVESGDADGSPPPGTDPSPDD